MQEYDKLKTLSPCLLVIDESAKWNLQTQESNSTKLNDAELKPKRNKLKTPNFHNLILNKVKWDKSAFFSKKQH